MRFQLLRPLAIVIKLVLCCCVVAFLGYTFLDLNVNKKSSLCQSLDEKLTHLESIISMGEINVNTILETIGHRLNNAETVQTAETSLHFSREHLRRRLLRYVNEIQYTLVQLDLIAHRFETENSVHKVKEVIVDLNKTRSHINDIALQMQVNLDGLGSVNGALKTRIGELNLLASFLRNRITQSQHPLDCSKAKFVVASPNRPCDFGCNAHHIQHCFQMAIATGRVLAITGTTSFTNWWKENFKPVSSCNIADLNLDAIQVEDGRAFDSYQAVECPYIQSVSGKYDWVPPAVPSDILQKLKVLHAEPFVWYTGQLASYLMRPKSQLDKQIQQVVSKFRETNDTKSPVVGIHVRRTDKVYQEASFHQLSEYMNEVEKYFQFIDARRQMMSRVEEWVDDIRSEFKHGVSSGLLKPAKRRVFIATDEPTIFDEARNRYPNYIFYGDPSRSMSASVDKRRQADSISAVVTDIIALAQTDFIVCTFSSQVCRLAYELMQAHHDRFGDASHLFKSLDDIYYFGGQQFVPYETLILDKSNSLSYGDLVHMHGNHWNGFAMIQPIHTSNKFLAPAYKFAPRVLSMNRSISV